MWRSASIRRPARRSRTTTPQTIWAKASAATRAEVPVAFQVARPANLTWAEILASLQGPGLRRGLAGRRAPPGPRRSSTSSSTDPGRVARRRAPLRRPGPRRRRPGDQGPFPRGGRDRAPLRARARFGFFAADGDLRRLGHYSRGLHSPRTGRTFRAATPPLFSFNSPLGACPQCRGFGRIIEIDYRLAIPDPSLSIDAGRDQMLGGRGLQRVQGRPARLRGEAENPTDSPSPSSPPRSRTSSSTASRAMARRTGRPGPITGTGSRGSSAGSRRTPTRCTSGSSFPGTGPTTPARTAAGPGSSPRRSAGGGGADAARALPAPGLRLLAPRRRGGPRGRRPGPGRPLALDSMMTRLRYLDQVGLGLPDPRPASKTLSGGEVERVNLTGCLGTSLVDTLFVLDEPSVGLHPRDIDRLIGDHPVADRRRQHRRRRRARRGDDPGRRPRRSKSVRSPARRGGTSSSRACAAASVARSGQHHRCLPSGR